MGFYDYTGGFNNNTGLKQYANQIGDYDPMSGYSGIYRDSRFYETPGVPIKAGIEKGLSKVGSFLKNPMTQMGLGGLIGGYTAFTEARDERNKIKRMNTQLNKSIGMTRNSQTGIINRGAGNAGTLMNSYALSSDPTKSAGYMGMYNTNIQGTQAGVDKTNDDIARLTAMIQRVPSKDSMWTSAFTGALGGVFGVGRMQAANSQRNYYDQKYNELYG